MLNVPGARSLVWAGGALVDVANGWQTIPVDGSPPTRRYTEYGGCFDAAVVSPDGTVIALMSTLGTKGLLLDADGRLLREVNRSFYHADAYRYPLTLFTLPDGRTGIVHCPEQYNRLEVEDAVSGRRLTTSDRREPNDFFHSRLAVSPSGRYLLNAGWAWHPWDCLRVYDLVRALSEPTVLDSCGDVFDLHGVIQAEVSGACFADDDIVVSTSPEQNEPEKPDDLAPNMMARWSTTQRRFTWRRQLQQTAGDLVAIADGVVLSLYEHPRLYDAGTGELMYAWPDLRTGDAAGSIVPSRPVSGPARIAVDDRNHRFAVTDGDNIIVVSWSET